MLDRPNVSANWSLGNTNLCRGHLRFRLAHAEIDGGGRYHPVEPTARGGTTAGIPRPCRMGA